MSQQAAANHGLFLVPKRRLECVPSGVAAKGPVLVTWTEPKAQRKRTPVFHALLGALAAPLGWAGYALFTSHRG